MNIAIIVQRFGKEVIGGAETHARVLAHRLKNDLNWSISVYTTTAKSYATWAPEFTSGVSTEDGIQVNRFDCDRNRSLFFSFFNKFYRVFIHHLPLPIKIRSKFESIWMGLQGPYSLNLEQRLLEDQSKYKLIIFFTYLYPTTNRLLPKLTTKTLLVPTAHNELPFYFQTTKTLLEKASYIYVNTDIEKKLIINQYPLTESKIEIAGLGFDCHSRTPAQENSSQRKPYLLYMGRVGKAKNVHVLTEYFLKYRSNYPESKLQLVLAGELDQGFQVIQDDHIIDLGYVSEQDKRSLLAGATALVSASYHESLAMIVLEAVAAKIPVLAAGQCELFKNYASKLKTVRCYRNSSEFSSELKGLTGSISSSDLQKKLKDSRKWLEQHLSWHKVLTIYKRLEHSDI